MTTDDDGKSNIDDELKKRIEDISQMTLELATGNFSYKIKLSEHDDELDGLAMGFNLMAEELQATVMTRAYITPEYKHIAGLAFVVDEALIIESLIPEVTQTLHFDANEMEGKPLSDFVIKKSNAEIEKLKLRLATTKSYSGTVELFFRTKETFVVPAHCSVSPLTSVKKHERKFLIVAIETIARTKEDDEEPANVQEIEMSILKQDNSAAKKQTNRYFHEVDFSKINDVQHLLKDLQAQWPLDFLAHKVGIEKRTLTKMFKKVYGKTVVAFVLDERMRKAVAMLNDPGKQLKEIAVALGYKNPFAFSRAFKKRYKLSPQVFREQVLNKRSLPSH